MVLRVVAGTASGQQSQGTTVVQVRNVLEGARKSAQSYCSPATPGSLLGLVVSPVGPQGSKEPCMRTPGVGTCRLSSGPRSLLEAHSRALVSI